MDMRGVDTSSGLTLENNSITKHTTRNHKTHDTRLWVDSFFFLSNVSPLLVSTALIYIAIGSDMNIRHISQLLISQNTQHIFVNSCYHKTPNTQFEVDIL